MSGIKVYMELEFDGTFLFSLNFSYVVYLNFFEFNLLFFYQTMLKLFAMYATHLEH
jgi:hypothetical protein